MSKPRFVSVQFTAHQLQLSKGLIAEAQLLEAYILSSTESSRERSSALTKLEECVMWVNRAIAVMNDQPSAIVSAGPAEPPKGTVIV